MNNRQRLGLVWVIMGTGWLTTGFVNDWPLTIAIGLGLQVVGSYMFQIRLD